MTLQEARDQLENNGYSVYDELQGDSLTYNEVTYQQINMKAFYAKANIVIFNSFILYRNLSTDDCYWVNSEPFMISRRYGFDVDSYLNQLKKDGIVEGAYIIEINRIQEAAKVLAQWIDVDGNWQEGYFLVDKDSNGSIQYREIK